MTAPLRVVTIPDIERLSFDLSAESASLYAVNFNPSSAQESILKPGPMKVSHNLQNCIPVPLRSVVEVERRITHNVRDSRPRHGRQSHRPAYNPPVRPVSSKFTLLSWT